MGKTTRIGKGKKIMGCIVITLVSFMGAYLMNWDFMGTVIVLGILWLIFGDDN